MTGRSDPVSGPGPRWYAIEARRPFLDDLAAGVLDWLGDHPPETLSDAVILLPNRRAARAFTAALTKLAGGGPSCCPRSAPWVIWKRTSRRLHRANWASTCSRPSPP